MGAPRNRARSRESGRTALLALGLGCVIALVAVGVLELLLRLAGFGGAPGDLYFTRLGDRVLEPGMYAPHRERFFALRAGYRHSADHAGANALGSRPFRGRPLDPAPDGPFRVAVFGDSCAFGLPLPANQALPAQLDRLLNEELGPGRAIVANRGVPGYSTVQIRATLERSLAEERLDAVVLYPAAWNDQAPSMGKNDIELRDDLGRSSVLAESALADALRHARGAQPPAMPDDDRAALADFGPRVPEEFVEGEVRAMIQACQSRGVDVLVIAPPHPDSKRESHPRMFRDADAVRRAARALAVPLIDEQATFGPPSVEDLYFADLVHPAPEGCRVLAERCAELLKARAPARLAQVRTDSGDLTVAAVLPTRAPQLGDVSVELRLEGWDATQPLPAVCVGGAALLDLEAAGANTVRGKLPHLAPGSFAVLVQTESAIAYAAAPLTIEAPTLSVTKSGDARRIGVRSRPGDLARVFVSTVRSAHAKHSSRGAMWIAESAGLPIDLPIACDEDGLGEAALPPLPGGAQAGPYHVQALIVPRGEPRDSAFAVWSEPARID